MKVHLWESNNQMDASNRIFENVGCVPNGTDELYEKAYDFHSKANDLDLYKVLIEIFPESPQANYARQQIKSTEEQKNN